MPPNKGGVVIRRVDTKSKYTRKAKKLPPHIFEALKKKLEQLLDENQVNGLRFEKLSGYSNPDIYTFHIDGNYKVSLEIDGDVATLRSVGVHNLIDRAP